MIKIRNKIQTHVFKENVKCTFQEKNWKRITYYIDLHCTFQTKWILKILKMNSGYSLQQTIVDASIVVNSELLEKEQQELSEIKTKKQQLIINLQKKRNVALQELIIKSKTDLKQKNETLAAIQKKCTVCQKVSKTTMAQCELEESKV